jgi:cytosine/uracil/thiamine/allantoin permease
VEASTRLYNEDLAPAKERNRGTYSLFAMWKSGVHSTGGYTFAPGLSFLGEHIDFRRGGMITSVVAIVVLPWYIFQSAWAVNYFLGGLGAVLGPLFGIIMADLYLLRKRRVDVEELYRERGVSSYPGGWNPVAIKAYVPAAVLSIVHFFHDAAAFSWFVGAGLGALLCAALNRAPAGGTRPQRLAREDEMARIA